MFKRITILMMIILMLAACTPTGDEPIAAEPTTEPTPADNETETETESEVGETVTLEDLEGTNWLLESYGPADNPTAVLPNSPVSLGFDNMGELGGQACNHYGGTFTLNGRTIEMGQISQTLMACADGGVTEQESAYTAALRTAETIYRDGDSLVITYDGGELRFTAEPEPEATELDGSLWRLSGISSGDSIQSALTHTLVLIGFDKGQIVGYAGCNQFGGPFVVEGSTITQIEAASTQMACLQEDVMTQEATFLQELHAADSFTLSGDNLTIGSLSFTQVHPPTDYLGTEFRLQAFNTGPGAQPPLTGTTITITFGEDGTVSGSAGCNTFNGPFTQTGTAISIDALAQTRMACEEQILTQETNVINYLHSARHAVVDGDQLFIVHDDGVMVFTKGAR